MTFRITESTSDGIWAIGEFDLESHHRYLKRLIRELKGATPKDIVTGRLESQLQGLFPEGTAAQTITMVLLSRGRVPDSTKLVKRHLARVLKSLERFFGGWEALSTPPIPPELEQEILAKKPSARLPWELEATRKMQIWRESLVDCRWRLFHHLAEMLDDELPLRPRRTGMLTETEASRVTPEPSVHTGLQKAQRSSNVVQLQRTATGPDYKYEAAISFCDEDVESARDLASALNNEWFSAYFSHQKVSTLWGYELYRHFESELSASWHKYGDE